VKAGCYILVAMFFCAGASAQPQKGRSVYLKIKGPEETAASMRAMFAEVASDNNLFLTDDPHRAGSQVTITIQEHKMEKPLYAEVVVAALVSRDGKSFPVYSCKRVTDGGGYSTITTKSGKANPAKSEVAKKTVWIKKTDPRPELVEAVSREMVNADFQLVTEEKDAEFTLKDIRLIKEPVHANAVEAKVESVLSPGKALPMTIESNIRSYLSVIEPISAEAEGCRDSLRHVIEESSMHYRSIAAMDLGLIARAGK
jgi:hypothetical protein